MFDSVLTVISSWGPNVDVWCLIPLFQESCMMLMSLANTDALAASPLDASWRCPKLPCQVGWWCHLPILMIVPARWTLTVPASRQSHRLSPHFSILVMCAVLCVDPMTFETHKTSLPYAILFQELVVSLCFCFSLHIRLFRKDEMFYFVC